MTPDIFLSYTREDVAVAQSYRDALVREGWEVWWDATLHSGEDYDEVTEAALRGAKAVVVLWSPRSVASRWVRAEATIAYRSQTLAPVMIEPCNRPVMFELTQTADLSHWTGEAADPAWRAFLGDVRRFVEGGAAPRPAAAKPSARVVPLPSDSPLPAIAVLPFINRSGRDEDDVFAGGMVEDLTAALSSTPWLRVVAASATAIYRGARDLRQIGRDLCVRYLLEGNVRRVGEYLRVTAQLVEAEGGAILWTEKFDRPLAELPVLQDDLVADFAAHLGVQVERIEMERSHDKPGSVDAWEERIRGASNLSNPTRSGWEAGVAAARRAIEIDPNSGIAYAGLAAAQGQVLRHRGGGDPELAREIADNVRRARALAPNSPAVLCASAGGLIGLGKVEEALSLVERAVAINPNFDTNRFVLGITFARLGRSAEALAEFDAVERLTPDSVLAHRSSIGRSIAHLQAGRLDPALEAAERAVRFVPGPDPLIQSMLCLAKSGHKVRAREALRRLREADPDISRGFIEGFVRDYYGRSNGVDEYVAIVSELWEDAASRPHSP